MLLAITYFRLLFVAQKAALVYNNSNVCFASVMANPHPYPELDFLGIRKNDLE
jgi:hypothetical protein